MTDASSMAPRALRLAEIDEIEVTVDKLVAGGEGLARFDGIPIFVPRSAPGDRLRVQVVERRPDYGRARIVEILESGPGRRAAPCEYFARCGGCDLQHLEDDLQVDLKSAATRETLARLSGIDVAPSKVIRGQAWGYRLRTQLRTGREDSRPVVGYFERGTHDLVAVRSCPILVPELERMLPGLAERLPAAPPRRLDLAAGDRAVTCAPVVEGLPHGEVSTTVGSYTYGHDARCFFQGHRELLGSLVSEVVGDWRGESCYDLYCGVGLFSLPLAARYRRVVAIDGDRVAARYARRNARRHRLRNLEVVANAVESWGRELPEGVDRVVADPPRSGLSPAVRRVLLERPPGRLTYVSCHPAALARDLKRLVRAFELDRCVFVDLFPQTGHMEVVVHMKRR